MLRSEIKELHYITHITNVSSILEHGILCQQMAQDHYKSHLSIGDPKIKKIRENKKISGSFHLCHYANLFFCARNAMMYRILKEGYKDNLTVLRVSPGILDLENVIVTEINAAISESSQEHSVDQGLHLVDYDEVFALSWQDEETEQGRQHKKERMMAEVLVRGFVPPEYIMGAYVANVTARDRLREIEPSLRIMRLPHIFFEDNNPTYSIPYLAGGGYN